MKRLALGVGALLLGLGLLGTGALSPNVTVALSVHPVLAGRLLTIEGTTDLPDGAKIGWAVRHHLSDPGPDSDPRWLIGDAATVDAGRFRVVTDLTPWPWGSITLSTTFEPGPEQPAVVRATFGDNGERLRGTAVYEDSGGYRRLEEEIKLTLP